MQFITDDQVRQHITHADAYATMQTAFESFGKGEAANLARSRATTQGLTISSMGAIIPSLGVMGVKIYPTIAGQFNFFIALFSAADGALLAMMQGNALTEFRTANVTLLAAKNLGALKPRNLLLFGSGVQARSHVQAFLPAYAWQKVTVIDTWGDAQALCDEISERYGVAAEVATGGAIATAVQAADMVLCATRSKNALFDGSWVKPGCFVAAIGSSKPDTRETDDALLRRCACIAVEEREQALRETGDFVLATPGSFDPARVRELGQLLNIDSPYQRQEQDITLYKSVGIGLEDIALAALLWKKLLRVNAII